MSYFGHFCTSSIDARAAQMPNSAAFAIASVQLSHMCINPTVTGSDAASSSSSSYELHVVVNGQVFHVASAEYVQEQSRVSFEANVKSFLALFVLLCV